jgi:hypothetical protein
MTKDRADPPKARAGRVEVTEPLRGEERYDYADAFEIVIRKPDPRSAEDFVRLALEQSPPLIRGTIRTVHRHVLRFELGPQSSPDHILGWKVVTSEPDVAVIETISSVLRAVIIARRADPTRAKVTTFLFYRRPLVARALFVVVGPLHRIIAPYLLNRAASFVDREQSPERVSTSA